MAAAADALVPDAGERRYLLALLAFVCFVTLFEGYDLLIINLALPYLGRDFAADSHTLGSAVGLINVGTIVAFIPVSSRIGSAWSSASVLPSSNVISTGIRGRSRSSFERRY